QKHDPTNPKVPSLDGEKITQEDLISRILVACADALSLIPDYYRELKGFTEKVMELVRKPYSKFIDIGFPKSRFSFRLLGLAKEGRIKRSAISSINKGFKNLDDYLVQPKENYSVIWPQTFSSEEPVKESQPINDDNALVKGANIVIEKYGWLQIRRIEKGFINFQAQSVKECPIYDVKHDKDQLYGFIRKNRHFILKCYQQKQYKLDHKGLSFDKVSDKVELKEKPKLGLSERITNAVLNPHSLSELHGEVINVKKLKDTPESYPDFLSTEKTATLIRSSPATWKTTTLREIIMASKSKINAIMRQMNSSTNARESENAMRDVLRSAQHILAMDAFANESETVEIIYDPNSGAEAMRIGYGFLKQGKHVAFVSTGVVMARALVERASKLTKPDNSPIKACAYYGDMDRKQLEAGISFEVTGHFDIVIAITNIATPVPIAIKRHREWDKDIVSYKLDDSPAVVAFIEVEHQKHFSARNFIEKFCSLIASTAKALDIKETDFSAIATARNLSSEEAKFLKLDQECSVEDTMALKQHFGLPEPRKHFLQLSQFRRQSYDEESAIEGSKNKDIAQWEDTCYKAKENFEDSVAKDLRKTYSANHWEAIRGLFQSLSFTGIDDKQILSDDQVKVAFEVSRERFIEIRNQSLLLFGFKSRAKEIPDLNSAIKTINAIYSYQINRNSYKKRGFDNQEKITAIKDLFDSVPITNNITSDYTEREVSNLSINAINEKALSLEMPARDQSIDSNKISKHGEYHTQDICHANATIDEASIVKKKIPKSLTSLSLEFLIKNESNIDMLIFHLQQKFQMSQEKL
ncbi:9643_t:CDS:10, partial [Scutellospora calospora]